MKPPLIHLVYLYPIIYMDVTINSQQIVESILPKYSRTYVKYHENNKNYPKVFSKHV
jgi:hypothetical protein